MTHRHEVGEAATPLVFVSRINSDQTEGRGTMRPIAFSLEQEFAYNRIKGQGVMGVGDGDVGTMQFFHCSVCPELIKVEQTIYRGDKPQRNLEFAPDGWRREYSPMLSDPEYKEYLRLKEKFE